MKDLAIRIAVVITVYNKASAIAATIGSVLAQSRLPDELIVVDDGSTDDSASIVECLLARADPRLSCQLIRQENSGVSAARNAGAKAARSAYIALLDGDDEWAPGYLAEVERLGMSFPEARVLTVRCARLNADGSVVPEPIALPEDHFGIVHRFINTYRRGYGIINSSSVTIHSEAWNKAGGFTVGARKGQDIFMWLTLGLSELFAHSAAPLSIWHDEHSGVTRRKGAVPQHLWYFLGQAEGREKLADEDLINFLGSNMLVQIGGHRQSGDEEVIAEILKLSQALPPRHRARARFAALLPAQAYGLYGWLRRRRRGLKR